MDSNLQQSGARTRARTDTHTHKFGMTISEKYIFLEDGNLAEKKEEEFIYCPS
jgi:ABC-type polar amino acid transport system ATPase subunit